ncbi:hypothetical protein ASE11_10115 [Hydrogenophaga sp. Root209]|uniref:response regulator n=1 Tax=Hydrogenophaga sp. Root209 TaxID=1736490 RepID=UPI0006F4A332|nr:response regulator [Hydrogenophaga sp. Root209]KRB99990.1 hypothetical protein ASE11_10115 [Hydrogenophaga sp. Root209]
MRIIAFSFDGCVCHSVLLMPQMDRRALRARTDERPSIDFLYADGQSKQLGRGWHMSRAERGRIKVFIVDDNEDAANLLGEAMQYYDHQTVVAFDSAEALNAIGTV